MHNFNEYMAVLHSHDIRNMVTIQSADRKWCMIYWRLL